MTCSDSPPAERERRVDTISVLLLQQPVPLQIEAVTVLQRRQLDAS